MSNESLEDIYAVKFVFFYNVYLPLQMTDSQLKHLVRMHSRPNWLKPRNFGFFTSDKQYYKIDLRYVMAIDATIIGFKDENGVSHISGKA